MTNTQAHATWGELLHSAVHTPGKLLAACTAFHNYSFVNAILALTQCHRRNLEPGPVNTYRGWLELKRQVRNGEKGITLCMPMQYKKRLSKDEAEGKESEEVTRSTLPDIKWPIVPVLRSFLFTEINCRFSVSSNPQSNPK